MLFLAGSAAIVPVREAYVEQSQNGTPLFGHRLCKTESQSGVWPTAGRNEHTFNRGCFAAFDHRHIARRDPSAAAPERFEPPSTLDVPTGAPGDATESP